VEVSVQYLGRIQVVESGELTRSASYSHSNYANFTNDRMITTIYTSIKVMDHGLEIIT
jgi:hypothetical protein